MLLVQGQAYRQQYGFNAIHLLPVNLYGPHDNFDPQSSHVIPALIRKCVEAARPARRRSCAGAPATPRASFSSSRTAREAIVLATERYDGAEPVNIGAGFEIGIRDLAELVAELTGFTGRLTFDRDQARRPAAADARRDARAGAIRVQGDDRFPRRAAPHDRLVPEQRTRTCPALSL